MKKKHQEPTEQLNTAAPAPEDLVEETYSLEEIMREFGGWTPTDEDLDEEPAAEAMPEPEPAAEPEPTSEPIPSEPMPLVVPKHKPAAKTEKAAEPVPEPAPEEPAKKKVKEPVQQETPAEPEEAPKQVELKLVPDATEEAPEQAGKVKPKFQFIDLSGDTIPFKAVTDEVLEEEKAEPKEPVEMPEEPEIQDKEKERADEKARKREKQRLRKLEAQRKKEHRAAVRAARREQPEVVYPSPEDACAAYARVGTLRLRLLVCTVLTIVSGIVLLLTSHPIGTLDLSSYGTPVAVVLVFLLLLQSVLSYEVFVRGIYQALQMKFDLMSLLTLMVLVCMLDAFVAIPEGRMPFCSAPALALLMALWGVALERKAKWRTLKTVLSMEKPVAAVKEEKAWHGLDCIFRQEGSLRDFTAMLETPDAAQKVMRIYAPIAAVVTAVLAGLSAWTSREGFLWAWGGLLTAALPCGGFIACVRPFSILANRLHKTGAAICGWRGAKILSGESGIVIRDKDLFPKSNITINGMKMYSDLPTGQVVGYATAVVQAAGSGLLPLFEEMMKNEDGRRYTADSFRQYEGGGLGAEIHGDVVLLGSLPFMRLMGIRVPEGTRVQSAVYISVNKELVGVFALSYAPSASTKSGLNSVLRSKGLTPILATRDFMITPFLLKKRYKIPADRVEFPVVAERIALSSEEAGAAGRQGALMTKRSFLSFASAVTGGRVLRKTVHLAVIVALLSGVLGMALLCLMTYLGSTAAASAINLLLYQLLWLVPTLLITGLVGKS